MWFHLHMPKTNLQAIVKHCDCELQINEIADYDGAHNGLQVENSGKVRRIAAAVVPSRRRASLRALRAAEHVASLAEQAAERVSVDTTLHAATAVGSLAPQQPQQLQLTAKTAK